MGWRQILNLNICQDIEGEVFSRFWEANWCYLKEVTLVRELNPQVHCAFGNVYIAPSRFPCRVLLALSRVPLIVGLPPRLTSFWINSSQNSSFFLIFPQNSSIFLSNSPLPPSLASRPAQLMVPSLCHGTQMKIQAQISWVGQSTIFLP